jgi:glycine/D-amino acid oxidase-like deaminating enzyme
MSLDLRTGRSVWSIGRQKTAGHRKLAKNIRTEVVVVGGGVSGALIAHELVGRGLRVVMADARDIAMGSTMASTAILSYEPDVHLIDLIPLIGEKSAVRVYRAGIEAIDSLEQTIEGLDDPCDFRRRDSLYLASGLKHVPIVKREFEVRLKHGFRVEWLTRKQLSDTYFVNAPCAILTRESAEVNPLKLTLALVRSGQRKGLKVFAHTKVGSCRREEKESRLITMDGFHIRTQHVIFATGYETQQRLQQKEVRLASSYAISSTARTQFPLGRNFPVVWESARPYLYLRTTPDGRIVAGGEDVNFVDDEKRDRLLPQKTRTLQKKIHKMFPKLSWKLATAWTGTFGESSDGLPYIGPHTKFPGAFFALGYGGNGITFAAIASTLIPDLLSGTKNADAKLFRFGRRSKARSKA